MAAHLSRASVRDIEKKTNETIDVIEKMEDPAARHESYRILYLSLYNKYGSDKPRLTAKPSEADPVGFVCLAGVFTLLAEGSVELASRIGTSSPGTGALAAVALLGGGALSGGGVFGLSRAFNKKAIENRHDLRVKFGSIRNARALHKLEQKVGKLLDKASAQVREKAARESVSCKPSL